MLIDRSKERPTVLMGKRSHMHSFMPNVFVFPGGRKDRDDWRVKANTPLQEPVINQLMQNTPSRFSRATAHSLAITAARELEEETSIHLSENGGSFDLAPLRFFARAITPLGHVKRYDTRFFLCFCDELGLDQNKVQDSDELSELQWIDILNPKELPFAEITRFVLSALSDAMIGGTDLDHDRAPLFISNR